jgi:hypothetical protein
MDTPTTSAAAAPSPAPTASPSAPSSSPSSPSTTSSAPASTPTTPDNGGSGGDAQPDNRSLQQVIADKIKPAFKEDGVGGELADPSPSGDGTSGEDDVTPPAAGEDGEISANEEPGEGAQAGEEAIDEGNPFASFQLEEVTELGPKTLAEKLAADPAAAAALEANPDLKNQLFAAARKAERAAKYDEILGSPDEAQVVVHSHEAFSGIREKMAGVQNGNFDSVSAVVNAMLEHATLKDEDGNPLLDDKGAARTDGSVGRFFKNWFSMRLEMLRQESVSKNDEEGVASIDNLMERAGLRAPSSANEDELSEELKAQKASIDAERAALDKERRDKYEADLAASDERVFSKSDENLDSAIKQILDKSTGLDNFSRSKVEGDIRNNLRKMIKSSRGFKAEKANIEARPVGGKREKALIELNTRYINEYLPKAAREVLTQAGASIASKAEERKKTQAAREQAARSEHRGSLPASRQAPAGANDSLDVVEKDLQAKMGRRPSTAEILAERMNRRMTPATR